MYQIKDIKNKILQGDCIEEMKKFPDNCIDTIVTDPPYGLEFMGKDWDKFKKINSGRSRKENEITAISRGPENYKAGTPFQQWTTKWATEALRIAKPGATMLVFGGTRTFHRLACGLEDAGWIIKDNIMWLYGQGFPKATDISKQIDKKACREQLEKRLGRKPTREEFKKEWERFRKVTGGKITPSGQKYPEGYEKNSEIFDGANANLTEPKTPEAKLWNGYKSHGLKPAYEPIIMCQKKNDGTYANNALKWGVSGLNIDAGRIKYSKNNRPIPQLEQNKRDIKTDNKMYGRNSFNESKTKSTIGGSLTGRFPANVIISEEVAPLIDQQSGVSKSSGGRTRKVGTSGFGKLSGQQNKNIKGNPGFGDIGGASRYFKNIPLDSRIIYTAKASRKERNMGLEELEIKKTQDFGTQKETIEGSVNDKFRTEPKQNFHPTVKPLKLMEYLVAFTSMPSKEQIYLDPFIGSGTTAMACKGLGRNWIGIEKEEEYVKIAKARIKAVEKPLL